jgi:anaerobic selenocysteine-containing dehydrogenase
MITAPAMTFREWNGPLTADLVREPAKFGLGQVPSRLVPDATTKAICGFCSTGCGLKIHLKDGEAINLTPDPDYPVNLGTACPKGWEALSVLDAPDRAKMPILHGKEVDWDTALRYFCDQDARDSRQARPRGRCVSQHRADHVRGDGLPRCAGEIWHGHDPWRWQHAPVHGHRRHRLQGELRLRCAALHLCRL